MRAFFRFNRGVLRMPLPWRLWLGLLVAANMVVPLLFLGKLEGRVVLGTFLLSVGLMTLITGRTGFSRLLGLGHVLWIPLVLFVWTRLGQHPSGTAMGLWLRALIVLNSLSLVFDAVDVARWVAGNRGETVSDLDA